MIDVSVNGQNISYSKISVSKSIETASGMFSITIGGGKLQYKYRDTVEMGVLDSGRYLSSLDRGQGAGHGMNVA